MLNIKDLFYKQKGFTLVEVLVSLAILSILVIGFLPIITGSFQRVITAGERSQRIFAAQNTMEIRIVDEVVFKGAEIPVVMEDGRVFSIKGGMVEVDGLQTFLPWVTTIAIEPSIVDEGYPNSVIVTITGENTNFVQSTSTINISNDKGYTYSPPLTVDNKEKARFTIPRGANRLTNAGSDYTVTINTGNEVVRGKLNIRLPRFITIKDNTILEVSNNILSPGTTVNTETSLNTAGKINRVFWEGNRFFAVGENNSLEEGLLYVLEEGRDWHKKTTNVTKPLRGLTYNGDRFVAVGDQGTIITSIDGNAWTKVTGNHLPLEAVNRNLNAVAWGAVANTDGTSKDYFIAVGEKYLDSPEAGSAPNHDFGIILVSEDGLKWNKIDYPIEVTEGVISTNTEDYRTFNHIAYNDGKFIAVGEKGSILMIEKDGENWKISTPENTPTTNIHDLNAIIFSMDKWITVGDSGRIFISTDEGKTWTAPMISGQNTGNKLMDITYGGIESEAKFIAVGSQVIATSLDGNSWNFTRVGTSGNVRSGIASRP